MYDTTRQEKEANFHDKWAYAIDINKIDVSYFDSPTSSENRFILGLFGELKGKRILDLGCGMGDAAVYFATQGASVYAIDISHGMIDITNQLAERYRVNENLVAQQMSAEKLLFEDNFFDYCYGNGVLHHVDFLVAIDEVKRVLKKGGQAAFIEPLSYNPVIWVYRIIADTVRTEDEHPLTKRDIQLISSNKKINQEAELSWCEADHKEFHLFTLLIMVWFFIGERISPKKERYWKRFIEQGYRYEKVFKFLNNIDQFLFRNLPFFRWLCWNTVISLRKGHE
jgi:ubiquinone/menaquinone biosynthesis C-methylase UbiE